MKWVVKRTGLSPHVIRVWERRYGALTPDRSPTNRRMYSEAEVARLERLARLTDFGHSISQIAQLPDADLAALAANLPPTMSATKPQAATEKPPSSREDPLPYLEGCLEKIEGLDGKGLEDLLDRASLAFSQQVLLEEIVSPLLEAVGERWQRGDFRIAQEHLASSVMRSFVGGLKPAYPEAGAGASVVVATPAGQIHELGALLAAKMAAIEGWKVIYLGANLPAEEIAAAVRNAGARLLALSIVFPAEETELAAELQRLSRLLPKDTAWVCGGRAAERFREAVETGRGRVIGDLGLFRKYLREKL